MILEIIPLHIGNAIYDNISLQTLLYKLNSYTTGNEFYINFCNSSRLPVTFPDKLDLLLLYILASFL